MRPMTLKAGLFVSVVALVAFPHGSFADLVAKGPHGGVVREAEGMHIEFLIDKNGTPKLYLYDKAMKPLERRDLEAKLNVKGHDGEQHSRGFRASKDPKPGVLYIAEPIRGPSDWDTAVVSIKVKDEWHHIRFSHH